jgi:tRNA(Ile)-lysidine synthase TilS/MesJ
VGDGTGPHPAVAQVRLAVRTALGALPAPYRTAPLLVACSGGADSLALAAAAIAVRGEAVHAAVVDHELQDGSAEQAAATAELLAGLGASVAVHRVEVVTRDACAAAGLPVWDDPHNSDARFTRVRLRREVLPLLEDVLAGGVAEALARTARQLREDCDALDAIAADLLAEAHDPPAVGAGAAAGVLRIAPLATAPGALRRRVLRAWLAAASVTGLTDEHLRAADALAVQGPDRGGVALPGGLELVRGRGTLSLRPIRWPSGG